jgi:hypothetical protein
MSDDTKEPNHLDLHKILNEDAKEYLEVKEKEKRLVKHYPRGRNPKL